MAATVTSLAREWPPALRLLLLYGWDPTGPADNARQITKGLGDPTNPAGLERLTGDQIAADPQALVAAATSVSMFGDRTLILVEDVEDAAAPALQALLKAPAGNPVIAVAGPLRKTSPLLKLLPLAGVLGIESRAASVDDLRTMAGEQGLELERDAAQLLFDTNGGDRQLLRGEVEKLALYAGAAPGTRQRLGREAVIALAAGVEAHDQNALLTAVLAGRSAEAVPLLAAMPETQAIGALRMLASRLLQLTTIRTAIENGQNPQEAVKDARIFWKEAPLWVTASRRFDQPRLAAALAATLAAERAVKSSGGLGALQVEALLLGLARG